MAVQYAGYNTIKIEDNPPGFAGKVIAELDKIAATPLGLRMLTDLNTLAAPATCWGDARVIIKRPFKSVEKKKWAWSEPVSVKVPMSGADGGNKAVALNYENAYGGVGTPSAVYFNPDCKVVPGQGPRPIVIGLAHELVHAWHNIRGIAKRGYDNEESFTVGIGPFALPDPNSITENRFRLEFGLHIRHVY